MLGEDSCHDGSGNDARRIPAVEVAIHVDFSPALWETYKRVMCVHNGCPGSATFYQYIYTE